MLLENIKTKGTLTLILTDEFGNVKQQAEKNTIMAVGLAYIASRMKDATATAMTHMAIGTGSTGPTDATKTILVTESARVSIATTTLVTTTVTNDAIQYVASFGQGVGTAAITEAGIFNANSAGTMLCRTVFNVINKGALDTLTITWKITIA